MPTISITIVIEILKFSITIVIEIVILKCQQEIDTIYLYSFEHPIVAEIFYKIKKQKIVFSIIS